jgi:hypothetical protein
MIVDLDEGDRQVILLAMAKLRTQRPGWDYLLRTLAVHLHGEEIYDKFRALEPTEALEAEQGASE